MSTKELFEAKPKIRKVVSVVLAVLYILSAGLLGLSVNLFGAVKTVFADTDPLIVHYDFDIENVSGNIVRDVTGNGHDGTMFNASLAGGRNGTALDLQSFSGDPSGSGAPENRVQSYVQIPEGTLSGLTETTIYAWVKFKYDAGNFWARVFDIGAGESAYAFVSKTNGAYFGSHGAELILPSMPNAIFSDDIWTNVCISISPTKFSYYIDGELVGEITENVPSLALLNGGKSAYIGKSQFAPDPCLSAYIDDFKIYNKYMTAAEVKESMSSDMTSENRLAAELLALDIGRTVGLTHDLALPDRGLYGCDISWESSDTAVIGNDGVINRDIGATDTNTATLTATVSYQSASAQKRYFVSVLRDGQSHYSIDIDLFDSMLDIDEKFSAGFFEDTVTLDGGLYAELIENRSFEFDDALESYTVLNREGGIGNVTVCTEDPIHENNTHYARIKKTNADGSVGIVNDGFKWIEVEGNTDYDFSLFLRSVSGEGYGGKVRAFIENASGKCISNVLEFSAPRTFRKFDGTLRTTENAKGAKLCILIDAQGEVDVDFLSLMPRSEFKGIQNIFNKRLVEMIDDLGFKALRFPGGCVMEGVCYDGVTLEKFNTWKDGIGSPETRKVIPNRWGGYQSNGIGYYEYFLLCEALGAQPIPVVSSGISCQIDGGSGSVNDHTYYCPMDELRETFVQDALDLIEYANGDETTYWGKKRIESGHAEPFGLKYLAIGNEQWGEEYFKRFKVFEEAIHEKYSEIVLVTTSGPSEGGGNFDYAWEEVNTWYRDSIVDEHYYMSTDWFLNNTDRYASYDRDGAKVYVGEYSVKNADGKSTLYTALAEAAYISGMVKNADVVAMHSYAPLLSRADQSIWSPNLIVFDSSSAYASAAYYMQLLYSKHTGNKALATTYRDNINYSDAYGGVYVGSYQTAFDIYNVKVTANDGTTLLEERYDDVGAMLGRWTFCNTYDPETSHFSWPNFHWLMETGVLKVMDKTGSGDGGRPLSTALDTRMIANNSENWKDYTFETTIIRRDGMQGVMLGFGYKDRDNYYRLNYGGDNNSKILLERVRNGVANVLKEIPAVAPVMQNDVEYRFEIVFNEKKIEFGVNGKTVLDYDLVSEEKDLFYDVTFDTETSEAIVKLVNTTQDALSVRLDFGTRAQLEPTAKRYVFTAPSKDSENSFETPNNVHIVNDTYEGIKNKFDYWTDPYTVTVLRIKVKGVEITETEDTVRLYKGGQKTVGAELYSGLESVEWSIEDTSVATVDANGKITAHAAGTTVLTASANNGQFIDRITVVVSEKEVQEKIADIEIVETTATGIVLQYIEGAEYSIDNGLTWQGNVFTGLEADKEYTFLVRMKETATSAASESLIVTARTEKEPDGGSIHDWIWFVVGGIVVAAAGAGIILIVAKKKRSKHIEE